MGDRSAFEPADDVQIILIEEDAMAGTRLGVITCKSHTRMHRTSIWGAPAGVCWVNRVNSIKFTDSFVFAKSDI